MTDAENDMMQQFCNKLHEANIAYEGPWANLVRIIADDGRAAIVCMGDEKWDVFFADRYRMYYEREEERCLINGEIFYEGLTSDRALQLLKFLKFDA